MNTSTNIHEVKENKTKLAISMFYSLYVAKQIMFRTDLNLQK